MAIIFKHVGKMSALDMVSDLTPAIVCENIAKCTGPLGIARLLDAEGVEVFWQLWVVQSKGKATAWVQVTLYELFKLAGKARQAKADVKCYRRNV